MPISLKHLLPFLNKPAIIRGMYAMLLPARVGQFLLCKSIGGKDIEFIQLPDRYTLTISKDDFTKALEFNHVEYVETLPVDVFEVCLKNSIKEDPLKFEHNFSGMEEYKMNQKEFESNYVEGADEKQ